MTQLQSQINAVKARIEQFRNSDLFTPEQKEKRIAEAERELALLVPDIMPSMVSVLDEYHPNNFSNHQEMQGYWYKIGSTPNSLTDYKDFPSD